MYNAETRRRITRAALLLAAARSENAQRHAFRIMVQKYKIQADNAEIEIEQAVMAADALRELDTLVTHPELG